MAVEKDNGWNEYQKLVLKSLEDLGEQNKLQDEKIGNIREDIAGLKIKSGVWGAIAGCIPVVLAVLGYIVFG